MLCVYDFFFFTDTATTEIYTLSLHDALPIWLRHRQRRGAGGEARRRGRDHHHREQREEARARQSARRDAPHQLRSEEHTSELQSRRDLVCRLLLEKKKTPQSGTCAGSVAHNL